MNTFEIFMIIFINCAFLLPAMANINYSNLRGITLELDEVYKSTAEVAYATVIRLRGRGKNCEIIESGNEETKLLVNGKKYNLTYATDCIFGKPTQVIELELCKG